MSADIRRRKGLEELRTGKDEPSPNKKTSTEFSLCWYVCKMLIVIVFLVPMFVFSLGYFLLPSPIDPVTLIVPPEPPAFEGALAPNNKLASTEQLLLGKIRGPESIAIHKGQIFTGTADGEIIRIEKDNPVVVARLGEPPCGKFEDEPTCGRPLGMRFDSSGALYVVDAYLGLYKVNVTTGIITNLVPSKVPNQKPLKFFNDLDITKDGSMIYFSDSSSKWQRRENRLLVLEGTGDGRVFQYNIKTKEVKKLVDNLHFANGIQLSPKEDYLLIVELINLRILKYHLKGSKSGQVEVFADNLPGYPDNIRASSSGGYWVGMSTVRRKGKFSAADALADKPWLRKMIAQFIDMDLVVKLFGKYGLIIELNDQGKIIRSFHDPEGAVITSVSEVEEHNGVLYLGSYFAPFLGKLKL